MTAEGTADPVPTEATEKAPASAVSETETADAKKDSAPPNASNEVPTASDEHSKRIYVSNLAWEVTSHDLAEHIKVSGFEVVSANVLSSPDGRSKGCAIVEFASADLANRAVTTLNDSELKGRQIFVREDRGERRASGPNGGFDRSGFGGRGRGRGPPHAGRRGSAFTSNEGAKDRRVYVGNLSWEVAWQDLKDHMVEAGEVVRAEVIKDSSGRSKGCGIVEYVSEEGAKNAIATLTDTELKGRRIFVREDREITKQAGRGVGGRARGDNRRFDGAR